MQVPPITFRDTDDRAFWITRLNATDKEGCKALIGAMLSLSTRLASDGVPAPHVSARVNDGLIAYQSRFRTFYMPA